MGLIEGSEKTYLKVSFGTIRKKCSPDTPGAVARETKDGEKVWGLEYRTLSGILEDVSFRDDEDYGKSWMLHVRDESGNLYVLQIQEDSRYGVDFLKKFPNLRCGESYEITPYDFDSKGRTYRGLSIKLGNDKIPSYYQEFSADLDGKTNVTNLHGYPDYAGTKGDKDDFKVYLIQCAKFLRAQALRHLETEFRHRPVKDQPDLSSVDGDVPV